MIKFAVIAAVLTFIAASVSVCGARADGDRLDPSLPFSEQVAQECKVACLHVFENKVDWSSTATSGPPPTEVYSKALTQLYFCQKKCQ